MSRRRYLSTDISADPRVNRLATQYGDFAALLYTWLIPQAADDCSLPPDPEEILFRVAPGRRDKSVVDVVLAVDGMVSLGLLIRDGERLGFPAQSFYKHQTYITDQRRLKATATPSTDEAQNSADRRTTPQNGELRRSALKSGENLTSSSSSGSSSSSSSSSPEEEEESGKAAPKMSAAVKRFDALLQDGLKGYRSDPECLAFVETFAKDLDLKNEATEIVKWVKTEAREYSGTDGGKRLIHTWLEKARDKQQGDPITKPRATGGRSRPSPRPRNGALSERDKVYEEWPSNGLAEKFPGVEASHAAR